MQLTKAALSYLIISTALIMSSGCIRISGNSHREFFLEVGPNRDTEALDRLIEQAGHIDARETFGRTFLYMSAFHGYTEHVEHLLDKGADPIRGKSGRSALHAAAQNGHLDIIKLLLEAGVDVDIRCRQEKSTPLMGAARNVQADAVALLLENGANASVTDRHRFVMDRYRNDVFKNMGGTISPRMDKETFNSNLKRTIVLLTEAGADINREGPNRRTPLMQMCYIGNEVGVSTLLNLGADPQAVNRNGQSVLEFAKGNPALVRIITEAIDARNAQDKTNNDQNIE